MSTQHFVLAGVAGLLLALASPCARADDLTTRSGRLLRNVEVTELETDFVTVQHDGGTERLPLRELPPDWQKRLSAPALFAELRRKSQELASLRTQVRQAAAKAAPAAPSDQPRARGEPRPAVPAAPGEPVREAVRPVPIVLSNRPPVGVDEVVSAEDLAGEYQADRTWSDRRYKGRTFRVRGVVDHFNARMFVRNYDVVLDSPERFMKVVCNVPFGDDFRAIYPMDGGQLLAGDSLRRGKITLLRTGMTVTFRGRCNGAKESQILFINCELVK